MNGPIGIIDSGVGGLSVLQALEATFPNEDVLYFCDNANFPYGEKTGLEIIRCLSKATAFLLTKEIKLLIVACHTASVYALDQLRDIFPIPIIGMVGPSIESLMKANSKGRIGIMATEATLKSNIYQEAIHQALPFSTLFPILSSDLARQIQEGDPETQNTIKKCTEIAFEKKIDTLLLACTHYAHLGHAIEEELPAETIIVNPAVSVVHTAASLLKERNGQTHTPQHDFYLTGDLTAFWQFLNRHPLKADYSIQNL